MAATQESWKDLASKVEALGLKLKLHLEQEQDETTDATPGDTKAAVEDLGTRLQDAFESFGNAAKDPAVQNDVKDVGTLLKDALLNTFNAVGAEVGDMMRKAEKAGEEAASNFGDTIKDAKGEIADTVSDTADTASDAADAASDAADAVSDAAGDVQDSVD